MIATLSVACSDTRHETTLLEPQFGPGGGGPPVKVTRTDPSSGEQGEVNLIVSVTGSNFEPGSQASFKLPNAPPGKVRTNATTFVSASELRVDIDIDDDADLGLYDVEVITPHGKKGVGTELFQVQKPKGNAADLLLLTMTIDQTSGGLQNDGNGPYIDGAEDAYVLYLENGNLNSNTGSRTVHATIYVQSGAGETTLFDGDYPMELNTNHSPYLGLDNDGLRYMEIGSTDEMVAGLHVFVGSRDIAVRYGRDCPGNAIPATRMIATHPDTDTWILTGEDAYVCEHKPPGKSKGGALSDPGRMPFRIILQRK